MQKKGSAAAVAAGADGVKKRPAGQLPEKYDVTIIVHPTGEPDVELKVNMESISRVDIMAPEYPSKGVTAAVTLLERSVEW